MLSDLINKAVITLCGTHLHAILQLQQITFIMRLVDSSRNCTILNLNASQWAFYIFSPLKALKATCLSNVTDSQ